MSELLLISASGLAREVLATVRSSTRYDAVGFLDDDEEMSRIELDGAPVLGTIDDAVRYTHVAAPFPTDLCGSNWATSSSTPFPLPDNSRALPRPLLRISRAKCS